ncbi:hypothetical protein Droror1_Dr00021284 [Drosera rotundifolia]
MQVAAAAAAVTSTTVPLHHLRHRHRPLPLSPLRSSHLTALPSNRSAPQTLRSWNRCSIIISPINGGALRSERIVARAAAAEEEEGKGSEEEGNEKESEKGSSVIEVVQLGALFGLWYLFNIYFNIYNKQVLKVFHFPVTISAIQFAVGTLLVLFMWTSNLYKRPKISGAQVWILVLVLELVFLLIQ